MEAPINELTLKSVGRFRRNGKEVILFGLVSPGSTAVPLGETDCEGGAAVQVTTSEISNLMGNSGVGDVDTLKMVFCTFRISGDFNDKKLIENAQNYEILDRSKKLRTIQEFSKRLLPTCGALKIEDFDTLLCEL